MVHEPTFMAYELRLLVNYGIRTYEPFLLGVGVVFNMLKKGTRGHPPVLKIKVVMSKMVFIRAEKTMTATDVTGFDAIFSTGFFATFSRF